MSIDNHGEIVIYQTEDGLTKINVNMKNETVWLSLEQMSELFQRDKSTISRHIKNIYTEGELLREATVANFATVQNVDIDVSCRTGVFGYYKRGRRKCKEGCKIIVVTAKGSK